MSEGTRSVEEAELLALTDEELTALASMSGHVWPRPLYSIDPTGDASRAVASGIRSLDARGLLASQLPEGAAELLGAVLAACEERPGSLSVAVVDQDFVVVPTYPRLEVLFLASGPLAVASTPLGVHTFRLAALDEVLDAFADWCTEWSKERREPNERVMAFARAGDRRGIAGYVLAPDAARLHRSDQGDWKTGQDVIEAPTLDLLRDLGRRLDSVASQGEVRTPT